MLILVVGKTCSGKDYVAHHIESKYGFHRIVSYTTRPMRVDDKEGVSHYFISEEQANEYSPCDMFAYTEINGYKYFTLRSQIANKDVVYVIDPNGIKDIDALGVPYSVLYIDVPEAIIRKRAYSRGDSTLLVEARLGAEREQFDTYKAEHDDIYLIKNTGTFGDLVRYVDSCMGEIMARK